MNAQKESSVVEFAEFVGAGLCAAGLYVAGSDGRLDMVLLTGLALFFIFTTRTFRKDRDALLEG